VVSKFYLKSLTFASQIQKTKYAMLFNLVSHMPIPSHLCSINRRHRMSIMPQPRHSGTRGLSEALLQWTRGLSTCDFICICICGLPVTTRGCEWVVTTICGLWSLFASMCCRYIYIWIACDVYCELSVMFIWMWSWLSPNQINWLFVASLPSVTLGKEAFSWVPAVNHLAK